MILLPARLTLGMPLMRHHDKPFAECATHFPELFRWVFLVLWTTSHLVALHGYSLGSEQGIQQEDPLGLHKHVRSIAPDSESSELLFNLWYLDNGTLAGLKAAVNHAILYILQAGSPWG